MFFVVLCFRLQKQNMPMLFCREALVLASREEQPQITSDVALFVVNCKTRKKQVLYKIEEKSTRLAGR